MKKLLALLASCAAMTCMFSSCGDEEKESSVSKDASVSDESAGETTAESVTKAEEATAEPETQGESESEETETEPESEGTTEVITHEYIEDADPTAFLGKWECEKMVIDGEELTDYMGIPIYAMFQFDIKEDGTANTPQTELADTAEYTWGMVSEEEIEIVSENGSALVFSFEGDKLAGHDTESDDVIYLVKVDEFTPFDFNEFMNQSQSESSDENSVSGEETETVDEE